MKKIMFNDKYGLTQAVLEGRKTQTRRIARISQHAFELLSGLYPEAPKELVQSVLKSNSRYNVGEVVAVAQSYRDCGGVNEEGVPMWEIISSKVGGTNAGWSNKMYVKPELMPHQIRITNVRVERLQDISDEDCLKEGIIKGQCGSADTHFMDAYYVPNDIQPYCTPQDAYEILIDKVSGKGTWENNPYVFVYDFELVK
ncbi:hypothetical protein [Barnesiella intestinihominis]|uniref:hypothetical protein n=1 Tax=Barnesiella intestinihominis TaxID=487174 RepID=UPI002671D312|nr:hypothetical protein [Barnesiella intestinihominis]